jgi:hypothetical protein
VLLIRIRSDPYNFPGSGSVSYSNEHKKNLTGRENLTTYTFWLGPGRPTDKENQRIRICIKQSDPELIKLKSRIRIRIKIVWIRNTVFVLDQCFVSLN